MERAWYHKEVDLGGDDQKTKNPHFLILGIGYEKEWQLEQII